jgi:hypothetical protein
VEVDPVTQPLGSAAEEALKLLTAVQEWARTRFDGEHLATGASECQVCPLCQGIALLRQVKPETAEHLLDAAASFVAAMKSALSQGHPPSTPAGGPRVTPIDIREG